MDGYPQQIPGMARLMELTPELIAHYSDAPQEVPVTTASPVMTAMVVSRMHGRPTVQLYPLGSVNQARLEHGPTLADAKVFVLYTCCVECGVSQDELRECSDCGIQACNCEVTEDPHVLDLYWCSGCQRVCGGTCCND